MRTKALAAGLILCGIATTALADAMDNPAYKTWAHCGIGTTITRQSSGDGGVTLIEKLLSVADDKCVVHTEIVSTKHKFPTRDEDVPRQLTDPEAIEKLKQHMANPVNDTVTTPAGEFKCKAVRVSAGRCRHRQAVAERRGARRAGEDGIDRHRTAPNHHAAGNEDR